MNIATLEQYVENKNKWRAIFNQAPLSLLNSDHRQAIADSIDSEMSPENLTCDGELPRSVVQLKNKDPAGLMGIDKVHETCYNKSLDRIGLTSGST
jgi:hypothetical protein